MHEIQYERHRPVTSVPQCVSAQALEIRQALQPQFADRRRRGCGQPRTHWSNDEAGWVLHFVCMYLHLHTCSVGHSTDTTPQPPHPPHPLVSQDFPSSSSLGSTCIDQGKVYQENTRMAENEERKRKKKKKETSGGKIKQETSIPYPTTPCEVDCMRPEEPPVTATVIGWRRARRAL
jgi:hypothetical protein